MNPGDTFALISIPIIDDDAFELTESFSASLSLVSPITPRITVSPDEASVTIEDDDSEFRGGVFCHDNKLRPSCSIQGLHGGSCIKLFSPFTLGHRMVLIANVFEDRSVVNRSVLCRTVPPREVV